MWSMRGLIVVAALVLSSAAASAQNGVARARQLYNQHQYDAAIAAAQEARQRPGLADAAAVVLARARLERFRASGEAADLTAARETLAQLEPNRLTARDRGEWMIGLGMSLYFDEHHGAAAEQFDAALACLAGADAESRDRVLEWWALAIDRQAQVADDEGRGGLYRRMLDRMEAALRLAPESPTASYWLAVGAAGTGNLDRAWDAAVAAWARAPIAGSGAIRLRDSLDRLVLQWILPRRARRAPGGDAAAREAALRAEWDAVKQAWSRR